MKLATYHVLQGMPPNGLQILIMLRCFQRTAIRHLLILALIVVNIVRFELKGEGHVREEDQAR